MLILCKFSLVGLNLLLLTHIAHAFVLFTANMEDVKKLARKFVSEQLAEKIVAFISTAAETVMNAQKQTGTNNPGAQETFYQVSEENYKYNEGDIIKSKEELPKNAKDKTFGLSEIHQDKRPIKKSKHKPTMGNNFEGNENYKYNQQDVLKSKEYIAKNAKDNSFGSSEIDQDKKAIKKSKHKQTMGNTFGSKSRYIDTKNLDIEQDADVPKTKKETRNGFRQKFVTTEAVDSKHGGPYRLSLFDSLDDNNKVTNFNSLEDAKVADVVHFEVDSSTTTPDEFPENDKYQDRALENELTTKKMVAEDFDQYGNKEMSLLATSGPMSLLIPRRRVNELRWWEKELPKPDTQQAQKL